MKCLSCIADIDHDSFYCDQCGIEIMLCETCAQPGNQKFCEFDGSKLAPARLTIASTPVTQQTATMGTLAISNVAKVPQVDVASPVLGNLQIPSLKLINHNLNIEIDLAHDDIIGRNTGPYAETFKNYSSISGKHLIFKYDNVSGWGVQDLGSTNGTKVSNNNADWNSLGKCAPNTFVALQGKAYILIANVEFALIAQTSGGQNTITSSNSTQRI